MKSVVSIIPYKVLPARLGGEKGIALFTEYLGREIPITAVSTKNNEPSAARSYKLLNIFSNSRSRYANILLYFPLKRILRETGATHLLIEHPYFGWLACILRKTLPITWVVHSHNIEYMRSRSIGRWWWKALMWYETWVYKQADVIFFISEDDLHHAVSNMRIDPKKSYAITYGVETGSIPLDIETSRQQIRTLHSIQEDEKILLFNGSLFHHSNYDAVSVIVDKINPILLQRGVKYKIIICGKGLPSFFENLGAYANQNVIHAGFVDDIDLYFKAAHVFLNPILSGGGIKTKAVEAIAMNCTVVSTEFGALGLKRDACGDKLQVVEDNNWEAFANRVAEAMSTETQTPQAFYDYYYWGNIAAKVAGIINETVKKVSTN
jgi:polysaccharide biosynthesis protein PslH